METGSSCPEDLMFHSLYKLDKFSNVNSISYDFHNVTIPEVAWVCQDFKKVGEAHPETQRVSRIRHFDCQPEKSHTYIQRGGKQRGKSHWLNWWSQKGAAPERKERWRKTLHVLLRPQAQIRPLPQGCLTGSVPLGMAPGSYCSL